MTALHTRARGRALSDAFALGETLTWYWLTIFPIARRELRRWRTRADAIPNPVLRGIASRTIANEGLNAEGAALFAMLAPIIRRRAATRLLVAFQVMYDYLDALTEQPTADPLRSSRQLHRALLAALGGPVPVDGYFAHHPLEGDGGYLAELVTSCRTLFLQLPSAHVAAPHAIRAAVRSAEGQSQSHAAAFTTEHELTRWATREAPPGMDLRWWETAAAAESSLVIHALIASAARSRMTSAYAARVASTYWPWITGLNALLDDLIDTAEDTAEGTHSYITHYSSPELCAARLAALATRASSAIDRLPLHRRHAVIFAAMTSYYLAAPQAATAEIQPTVQRVSTAIGVDLRLLLAMLRARRAVTESNRARTHTSGI